MNRSPPQLELFVDLQHRDHDPTGLTPPEVADWV